MITVNKANPTPGEITSSLTGSTGDGAGLHFNGSGYVSAGDTTVIDGATKLSVEVIVATTAADDGEMVAKAHAATALRFLINTSGQVVFRVNNGSGNGTATSSGTVNDGNPTHIVGVWDGSTVKIYINGNEDGSAALSGGAVPNTADKLALGTQLSSSDSTANSFTGTLYRARLWNKAVDAKALFERADVDFADQYGSGTARYTSNFSSGVDGFAAYGSGAAVSHSGSQINVTGVDATGKGIYKNSLLNSGFNHRITVTGSCASGTKLIGIGTSSAEAAESSKQITLTTTPTTFVIEEKFVHANTGLIALNIEGQDTNNVTFSFTAIKVEQIGVVSDYDLAFANPTQSRTIQDRSTNNVDGTASTSGVTQVQKVVQLNAERLSVGGTVPRVGIGLPVADTPGGLLSIDATNSNTPKILFENQAGETADAAITTIDDTGGTDVCIGSNCYINSSGYITRFNTAEESSYIYAAKTGNVYFGTGDTSATASSRVNVDKNGNVGIGVSPSSLLHINGDTNNNGGELTLQVANNNTTDNIGTINFGNNVDSSLSMIQSSTSGNNTTSDLSFHTSATGTQAARLTIDSSGDIILPAAGQTIKTDLSSGGTTRTGIIELYNGTTGALSLKTDNQATGGIEFWTEGTKRLDVQRDGLCTFSNGITVSGGNLLLGKTSAGVTTLGVEARQNGILAASRDGATALYVERKTSDGSCVELIRGGTTVGTISVTGSATAYNTSSDYRLKENLTPLTGALDRLDALPVYRFNFKTDPDTTVDGFVAHEVSAFVPEAVTGEKDAMKTVVVQEAVEAVEAVAATYWEEGDELPEGVAIGDEKTAAVEAVEAVAEVTEEQPDYQGIDQSKLVPLLVAAVKELKVKVETLENA